MAKKYLCCKCGEDDRNNFYDSVHAYCKSCQRQYVRNRYHARKKSDLVEKFGGKCQRCGWNERMRGLEFHHLDPSKKDPGFGNLRHWGVEKATEELKGCVLLCACCHRVIHDMMDKGESVHGEIGITGDF